MDVVVWLRSLGLRKYEAAFRDNEIDETVLPSLTAEDLKDLGVSTVGHRRKLLNAIAALRNDTSAVGSPAEVRRISTESPAERRQVTVMFSDLVGSTALSSRMDPEDFGEIVSAYHKCVAETVQRFGGFVAAYTGHGAVIYLGYPEAHEDDAERAVRAALEMVAAVSGLKTHAVLQTRVGIATGLVVVGNLFGSGASWEQAIVGETPNLAARLQSIAKANRVVIAESTRRLVGELFELEDLGAQNLKGIAGPVQAWAALGASSVESRFEALHTTGLTELVGREEELDLLLRRWSKAKSGEGQVVLLSGEAGIGKSRITIALLERLAQEPHTRLRYFCSPQHTSSAFFPIVSQMVRAAGFAQGDLPKTKLDKLDALLRQSSTSPQDAALLAEMLSLPNDDRHSKLELAPQQRRRKTLEALTAQLESLSRSKPALVIFEDLQWIDPTSLEALDMTVDRIKALPALLIATYRPEADERWLGRPNVTALTLNRLGERETAAIIDRVAGDRPLPASVRADIIERTDGIPLFAEEMTKAALEAGDGEATRRAVAAIPSPSIAVPASLHASLMARLDRLGAAKEVAQIGAVIGREFSHALVAAVAGKPGPELKSALDRLIEAGLLFRQGIAPHATYLFKHALVQDAAYGTLLREPRRALHARIADTLEAQFTDTAENQPELLARHCTEAGLIEKAVGLWAKAGQRSLERSALAEAIEHLTRALAQIATLPATPALRREEIKLRVALITPLMHVKGYAALETKAAVEQAHLLIKQAEALGEAPDDPLLLFSVLYGLWVAHYVAFDGDVMRGLAVEFLALAEKQKATVPLMTGHRLMGVSLLNTGNFAEARTHLDRGIVLYDPVEHRVLATRFGQDARVAALFYRSLTLWLLGYPDIALADADRAVKDAREIGQAATLLPALGLSSMTHIHCGNYAVAGAQLDEVVALADETGALLWKWVGRVDQGCVLAASGKASDAVRMITSGITAWRSTGTTVWQPVYLLYLARSYGELGQLDGASRCVDEALTAVRRSKESWYEAEIHRIGGALALIGLKPDAAKAQAYFKRALAVARQQQAKSWELRAAMSLARLWRDQGKVQQARELLAPVYGWFTEGFDTRDLKEAKALLEELAS
jgi:class 3 adenylate cyclase/predicted ATPase